ncbi:MurR/RpiR family transcriptional regulator [Staphylococcus gallinarum]|uniref:MurR/RpiR family transcriptional regulator n=1 Tax=Staphylococcus gallinarum TaxID=1293 RepID=UPI001E36562F|nr:MurR/RpiR family transcriptional regulator [Staphylococcus gallinarum]MCD8921120.1 MurR/RpiR family transcriptional regulator [Staphylococcus gallinarum]MEB6277734.1 MurR/RpiR family transcriptional regulator [Staphylococcus gallinarum]UEH00875.1 MurR/RpiR family transcriptional regulator [Staphylococcus gallinarum]
MVLDHLINENFEQLTENDLHIMSIIHQHIDEMTSMKIHDLSLLTHTSISTIHRLVKKLGFEGYSDFKFYLKMENHSTPTNTINTTPIVEDIQRTVEHLQMFDYQPLNEFIDAASFIYIYGTGMAQQNVAREAQRHMLSISKKGIVLNDESEFRLAIQQMTQDDLLFIISLSGETENLKAPIQLLKSRNYKYVSITTLHDNYIAKNAAFNIYVNSAPIQFFNNTEYYSFTPYYVVFDFIARTYHNYKVAQHKSDTR